MILLLKTAIVSLVSIVNSTVSQASRIALLQHQLYVYQRQRSRPKLKNSDRVVLMLLARFNTFWKADLFVVKPATLIGWHRILYKRFWTWKSKPGRKPIPLKVRLTIKRLHTENPLWGARRIYDELSLLGYGDAVCLSSVKSYLARLGPRPTNGIPTQSWTTFIKNHLHCTAAMDFFTVPTIAFKTLYCLVILSHDNRSIIHFNVTRYPTLPWVKQQIRNAFYDTKTPRYMVRDNDGIYGNWFENFVALFGITDRRTSFHSPWQNGYCERVIGSIRRECLDHMIIRNEEHLHNVLKEYVTYYNTIRPHQSLSGSPPTPRTPQNKKDGNIVSVPILNGLHHHYYRTAA